MREIYLITISAAQKVSPPDLFPLLLQHRAPFRELFACCRSEVIPEIDSAPTGKMAACLQ